MPTSGRDALAPKMIRHDHVIGKSDRQSLHEDQATEGKRIETYMKLAGVKFREHVVNVENDLGAEDSWNDGCKDQEVGNRMHMDKLIAARCIAPSDKPGGKQQKANYAEKIGEGSALVDGSGLDAENINAIENAVCRLSRTAKRNDIDRITPFYESIRVLLNARIVLVERVCQHANFHRLGVRHRRNVLSSRLDLGGRLRLSRGNCDSGRRY